MRMHAFCTWQVAARGAQHLALSAALLGALRGLSGLWWLQADDGTPQCRTGQQVLGASDYHFHQRWDDAGLPAAMRRLSGVGSVGTAAGPSCPAGPSGPAWLRLAAFSALVPLQRTPQCSAARGPSPPTQEKRE